MAENKGGGIFTVLSNLFEVAKYLLMAVGMAIAVAAVWGVYNAYAHPPICLDEAKKACEVAKENFSDGLELMDKCIEHARKPEVEPQDRAMAYYEICFELDSRHKYDKNLLWLDEAIKANIDAGLQLQAAMLAAFKADELHKLGRGAEGLRSSMTALDYFNQAPADQRAPDAELVMRVLIAQAQLDAGDVASAEKTIAYAEKEILPNCMRPVEHYPCRLKVEKARVLLAEKKTDEADIEFKSAIAEMDKFTYPCAPFQEEMLLDYVKSLKFAGYDSKANFYNEKLDRPLSFDDPKWKGVSAAVI